MATKIHPAFLQAAKEAATKFNYGEVIPKGWLVKSFDLAMPTTGDFANFQKFQLEYLKALEAFKVELLREYKMMLRPVNGTGYQIIRPENQADEALKSTRKGIRKALAKGVVEMKNINTCMLSDEQRRHADDRLGQLAGLRVASRKMIE